MHRRTVSADSTARRDLSLYWWGQTTSALGSTFTGVALPVIAVVYLNASPGQVGVISAASILPVLLFGLPAGSLADRIVHPRRTLIALDSLSAVAVAAVALGLARHAATIGWLVALCVVQGAVTILSEVTYFIHLSQLVGTAGIGPARARLQAGEYGAGFAGRLLAGPAIVLFGSAAALSVDAVSYLLSAAALLGMHRAVPVRRDQPHAAPEVPTRAPARRVGHALGGFAAGVRFFTGDAFHRALMVFIIVPIATAAGAAALTAPFLLHVLRVPTGAYGAVFALSGLMGLTGSIAAGRVLRPRRDPRQVTLAAFTAASVCGLLLPLSGGPLPLAALCAALGISVPMFFGAIANVALSPVIVADVPEDAMGRTMALLQVFAAASGLVGALAGGALGDWIGVRQAIWTLDAVGLAAIVLSLHPAVRAARRLREAAAPAPEELVLAAGQDE